MSSYHYLPFNVSTNNRSPFRQRRPGIGHRRKHLKSQFLDTNACTVLSWKPSSFADIEISFPVHQLPYSGGTSITLIQVKLCCTYMMGRNTLQTVLFRTSSQMVSFISISLITFDIHQCNKGFTYTSPYEKVKKTHFKTISNIFNLEPTLCQCGCAKDRGLVGIKIQGDYQLHSVELARKMAETE